MSELSFKTYSDKFTLVIGDKKKYSALLKQVSSRWSNKHEGWLVPVENDEKLKQLVSILYPQQKKKSPSPKKEKGKPGRKPKKVEPQSPAPTPLPVKVEKPAEKIVEKPAEKPVEKVIEQEITPSTPPRPRQLDIPIAPAKPELKKFRRSRSPRPRSDSSSSESEVETKTDPIQYYKTFKHSPNTFSSLHDNDDLILSTSEEESESDSDNSDSSEDYPNPSPNRKKLINDNVFDEMDKLRKRLYQLEQKK
jgi:hypothetical protein